MDNQFIVQGRNIKLNNFDPNYDGDGKFKDKDEILSHISYLKERFSELHNVMYAQKHFSLLLVFQGMDCCGKDGIVKKILSNINPHGFKIASFKSPTPEELSYDFLWRIHKEVPPKGHIGIFNRSHYEDVLVPRVKGIIDEKEIKRRLAHINNFERLLLDNNTIILKFFLNISKDEQKMRIQKRLTNNKKMWKFHESDLEARQNWDLYMGAYEDILNNCSNSDAPWYVIPANKKWFRDFAVLGAIVSRLEELDLQYPTISKPINLEFE